MAWQEKFDEKYYSKYLLNGDKIPAFEMNNAFLEDIKQFISTLLQEQKREVFRSVEDYIVENEKRDYQNRVLAGEEILDKLKSLINK